MTVAVVNAEGTVASLSASLHQVKTERESDQTIIQSLRADLFALAQLDDSLKAAAACESQQCNELQLVSLLIYFSLTLHHLRNEWSLIMDKCVAGPRSCT